MCKILEFKNLTALISKFGMGCQGWLSSPGHVYIYIYMCSLDICKFNIYAFRSIVTKRGVQYILCKFYIYKIRVHMFSVYGKCT